MGSLVKKIRKRAAKFQNALQVLEKNLEEAQGSLPTSFERFDLVAEVKNELDKSTEEKRKSRNKRKAVRRARRAK